ncbi:MAG: SDR family oxidoreductase [Planctomycetota bacterium]|nr:SDR family oxidoreductase [Planctomycetota bacterium]
MKHVAVAGGARGIGGAIARRLARGAAKLYVLDLDDAAAEATVRDLRREGTGAEFIRCDISSQEDVAGAAERVRSASGRLDIAVNSVGIFDFRKGLMDTPEAEFDRIIRVNLKGAFLFSKAFVPLLRGEPKGNMVHIGSVNGVLAGTGLSAYKVSKAALHMLARCMALELAHEGIRVNVVMPGWVETPGERAWATDELAKDPDFFKKCGARSIPMGRLQTPEEIAECVAFVASEAASAITGALIPVSGGLGI